MSTKIKGPWKICIINCPIDQRNFLRKPFHDQMLIFKSLKYFLGNYNFNLSFYYMNWTGKFNFILKTYGEINTHNANKKQQKKAYKT